MGQSQHRYGPSGLPEGREQTTRGPQSIKHKSRITTQGPKSTTQSPKSTTSGCKSTAQELKSRTRHRVTSQRLNSTARGFESMTHGAKATAQDTTQWPFATTQRSSQQRNWPESTILGHQATSRRSQCKARVPKIGFLALACALCFVGFDLFRSVLFTRA